MGRSKKSFGRMSHESMCSVEASRARTSVSLDDVPALKASTRDYGLTSPKLFAFFDPATSSWKTSQPSLFEDSIEYSGTWSQAGMTRSGSAYRLPPLVDRTYDLASGFLPTPVASEVRRTTVYSQGGDSLAGTLGGWPDPPFVEWLMGFPPDWSRIV